MRQIWLTDLLILILMEILKLSSESLYEKAVAVLKNGGVLMHPTETCYGLAVDIFNEKALEKLYAIKGRDAGKPVSILVSDLNMALKYGEFSDLALFYAKKYWPGPLSILVPRRDSLPAFLNKNEEFVSIRHSSHELCQQLPKLFGSPVTTTSANLAGNPALYRVDLGAFGALIDNIDLIIDGGEIAKEAPSTIIKVQSDKMEIVRQGGLFVEHKN